MIRHSVKYSSKKKSKGHYENYREAFQTPLEQIKMKIRYVVKKAGNFH